MRWVAGGVKLGFRNPCEKYIPLHFECKRTQNNQSALVASVSAKVQSGCAFPRMYNAQCRCIDAAVFQFLAPHANRTSQPFHFC